MSDNFRELRKTLEIYSNIDNLTGLNSNLLEFLTDILSDSIWQWDINSNKLNFSKNIKNSSEVLSNNKCLDDLENFMSIIHPEDVEGMKIKMVEYLLDSYNKNRSYKNIFTYSYRIKSSSGTWLKVHNMAKVVLWNDDGSPSLIVGIHINI
jgi:hypothetical protein